MWRLCSLIEHHHQLHCWKYKKCNVFQRELKKLHHREGSGKPGERKKHLHASKRIAKDKIAEERTRAK